MIAAQEHSHVRIAIGAVRATRTTAIDDRRRYVVASIQPSKKLLNSSLRIRINCVLAHTYVFECLSKTSSHPKRILLKHLLEQNSASNEREEVFRNQGLARIDAYDFGIVATRFVAGANA